MGTRYHIVLSDSAEAGKTDSLTRLDKASVERKLIAVMDQVNDSMSSYYEKSEVSRFNRLPVQQCMMVSELFADVLTISQSVYVDTNNAFDITIAPLVELWGFGASERHQQVPDEASVQSAKKLMGMDAFELRDASLCKLREVHIDVAGVAKGYAVDRVAEAVEAMGVTDYLVEIGGETRVAGTNARAKPWVIGLEKPSLLPGGVQQALVLGERAVATSGSYRNFFSAAGKRYSHILDPRSGVPVKRDIISLTIVDASTARADAMATGLMVLGSESVKAMAIEQSLPVYLMIADDAQEEGFVDWYSPAMADYLLQP